jgi:hypothetical protein
MQDIHPQFITDSEGNRISVVLPMEEYRALLEELDMADDIRLYDEAKASNEPSIPLEEALKMIDSERKSK